MCDPWLVLSSSASRVQRSMRYSIEASCRNLTDWTKLQDEFPSKIIMTCAHVCRSWSVMLFDNNMYIDSKFSPKNSLYVHIALSRLFAETGIYAIFINRTSRDDKLQVTRQRTRVFITLKSGNALIQYSGLGYQRSHGSGGTVSNLMRASVCLST